MARRKTNPFGRRSADDESARAREVEALLDPRRTVVQDLPVARIEPNPYQARTNFDEIEELADAIREQGFTSRLRVRPHPHKEGYFQLVFGERRLRAAKLAGLSHVPCEIAEHSDEELIEIGLAENIQRRDLHPLEEARAFQTFIEERGYSIRRLAQRIGKSKGYLQNRLALLTVPPDVQAMIEARPDALRAAQEIGKLDDPRTRQPLIRGVLDSSLSNRDVSREVKAYLAQEAGGAAPAATRHGHPLTTRATLQRELEKVEKGEHAIRRVLRQWQLLVAEMQPESSKALHQAITTLEKEMHDLKQHIK